MSIRLAALVGSLVLSQAGLAFAQDATNPSTFLHQEGADLWRASKLAGVSIYGPDQQRVGTISDVLVSHEGGAKYVVVGVGGFLGIGTKDVAIPFDQVAFTDQPVVPLLNAAAAGGAAPGSTAPSGMATSGTMAPAGTMAPMTGGGLGTPGDTTGSIAAGPSASAAEAAATARSTTYPDHGTVTLTRDQLKAAPDFRFAN